MNLSDLYSFLALVISIIGLISLILCTIIAVRALLRAIRSRGDQQAAFLALALNMGEPLVNTITINLIVLYWNTLPERGAQIAPLTSSMALLLLPTFGLLLRNAHYARLCGLIATLGLARWTVSAFVVSGFMEPDTTISAVAAVAFLIGTFLLLFSAYWGWQVLRREQPMHDAQRTTHNS
jgi:heme exporter protein D